MKVTRIKNIKKITSFYTFIFKLEQPLRVFLHHSIVQYCIDQNLDLQHLLTTTFQQPIKITTLKCSKHLKLEKPLKKEMKKFLGYECHNEKHDEDCFDKLNGVLCVQEEELRKKLNEHNNVPFMYFNNSTLVMEPISKQAREIAKSKDLKSRQGLTDLENKLIANHVEDPRAPAPNELGYKGKMPSRKKIKGPNPLSCKSKKIVKRTRRKQKKSE